MYDEKYTDPEFLKRPKINPFQTPDHYFESIEDRVMGTIKHEAKKKTSSIKIFQLLKPVLGLAASFAIVFLLVYYPINHLLPKSMVKVGTSDTTSNDLLDSYTLNVSLIDENSLVNVLFGDESNSLEEMNPDDLLAYLSSDMSDVEIYSEIQN